MGFVLSITTIALNPATAIASSDMVRRKSVEFISI
jgi:hypothetical protein